MNRNINRYKYINDNRRFDVRVERKKPVRSFKLLRVFTLLENFDEYKT